MKNLCVITPNYPHPRFPEYGAFVENHVREWQNSGLHTDVIAPLSIPNLIRTLGKKRVVKKVAGNQIERPQYMSYSNKTIGPVELHKWSRNNFIKAAIKGVRKLQTTPDLFLGKFLLNGGIAALEAGVKQQNPVFVDLGESQLKEKMNDEELELAYQCIPRFDGIICVSQRLADEAIEFGANSDNILLAPNTVDTDRFYSMDKAKCRNELGLPKDQFIVIFVGHFIERKGPLRVLEAINSLNGNVKGVFLGRGKQLPEGQHVLFTGSVPNNDLPLWLNAADVFVLPTLAEGNCNAINEAMACGLPVISSNIPDIKNHISQLHGLFIDPYSISELEKAIKKLLLNADLLCGMKQNCLSFAEERFSVSRPELIREWIVNRISKE